MGLLDSIAMTTSHWMSLAVAALTACGGGSPISEAAYPDEVARAACAKLFDCCDASEVMIVASGKFTDEASCRVSVAANMRQDEGVPNTRFDGDAARDCVDAYAALSCSAFGSDDTEAVTSCTHIYVGTIEDGQACEESDSCKSGFCEGTTTRTCGTLPGNGEACAQYSCAEGLACSDDMICEPPHANGAACWMSDQCTSRYCNTATMMCEARHVEDPAVCDGK